MGRWGNELQSARRCQHSTYSIPGFDRSVPTETPRTTTHARGDNRRETRSRTSNILGNRRSHSATSRWKHSCTADQFHRKPSVNVHPISPSPSMQLKGELQDEFGPDYQVLAASHFLFVVPRQSNTDWPQLFQQMHASLIRFFTTRGIVFQPAEFPLVTVVFRTEQEFHRYAMRENTQLSSSTLGYYSILSNRMVLFDRPSSSSNWFSTHKTIFHEATHQFAFNSGIHQRMSQTPLWVVEGLASLFEAPVFRNRAAQIRETNGMKVASIHGSISLRNLRWQLNLCKRYCKRIASSISTPTKVMPSPGPSHTT